MKRYNLAPRSLMGIEEHPEGSLVHWNDAERLREALSDLVAIYARIWDRVDGALVLLPDSIPRFEKANLKARQALRGVQHRSTESK